MEPPNLLAAVVDDEAPVCKALGRLLRASGFQVQCFGSGQEFIESLTIRRPDCLILDIHMPGMTGYEVQARLQESGLRLPVVFVTAFEDADLPRRVAQADAAGFLHKPFSEAELLEALRLAMETVGSVGKAS